jgi:hypothetical protein
VWYNDHMNPTIKTTPKDFFLHLAATVVLYASVIALVNLAMSIINYAFPDALAGYYFANSIAWPISMLIILVPVTYVVEWFIKKDIVRMPEKDMLWIRRWRIYLTLFLAGATIIGDLIALINTYINGEISVRFVYKFLAVLVIFGVIFTYYILEKATATSRVKLTQRILAIVGIILVLAGIVGGFLIVGSPVKQRNLRLDTQRVNDLSTIQWQVVSYWQRKTALPKTLEELKDPISGMIIPTDPETKTPYVYNVKGNNTFELCATFGEKTLDNKGRGPSYGRGGYYDMATSYPMPGGIEDNWAHEAGQVCFDRTIDPERYPPLKDGRPIPY